MDTTTDTGAHEAPTITLGTREEVLVKPSGMTKQGLRAHLSRMEDNPALLTAVAAAALALCWPTGRRWVGSVQPKPWRVIKPIEEYGAAILNDLDELYGGTSAGITELQTALMVAFSWAVNQGIIEREVAAAEDFSEPPEGAASSG